MNGLMMDWRNVVDGDDDDCFDDDFEEDAADGT